VDVNRGLDPALVEVDNLGCATSDPSPYTLLWWLKKILEASGGTSGIPVDKRSPGYIDIDTSIFASILTYNLSVGETLNLGYILISLKGSFAHFIVEYYNGTVIEKIREYFINYNEPTFIDTLDQNIPIAYVGAGSKIEIKAKMEHQNHQGKAYSIINGYK